MHSAGVKNYHYALLQRLLKSAPGDQLKLYPYLDGISENFNEGSNFPHWYSTARLVGLVAENRLRVPFAYPQSSQADLFHITPHVYHPPTSRLLTSMIHDATPLTHPECHQAATIELFERFAEKTAPKLSAVIVPSHAVKQDLVSQMGLVGSAIEVIHHGVDEDFFASSPGQHAAARKQYQLPAEFVLFVGSMEPRKNLLRLVEAHGRLPESVQSRYPLVVVGSAGWHNEEIQSVLRRSKHVQMVGYVSRRLLPAVYACASLFAFPTLYEGFGMPLLEAMAAGTPVVTSNVSAMPEVVGDCGITVDPYDVGALRDALVESLEDRNAAAQRASRASVRARGFSWDRTAAQTWAFFQKTAGEIA
jgi:glycosyltransferase involved in cell wall biosynthesis